MALLTDYYFHNEAATGYSLATVNVIGSLLPALMLWVGTKQFKLTIGKLHSSKLRGLGGGQTNPLPHSETVPMAGRCWPRVSAFCLSCPHFPFNRRIVIGVRDRA